MDSMITQKCTADDVVSLADVHLLAAQAALDKMFSQGYLSICDIDNINKMTETIPDRTAYKILHTLHCVHYNMMDPLLRRGLPQLITAVLKLEHISYAGFKP